MHKLEGMIGLCVKAGRAVFGSEACTARIQAGRLPLVIVAGDAAGNTKKRILDKCHSFGGNCIFYGTVSSLAHAAGKQQVSVLGIQDKGFAAAILKIYGGDLSGKNNETK